MSLKCGVAAGHHGAYGPCDLQWIAVQHGNVRELRGEYCLQVRWENGKTYRGAFVAGSGKETMKLDISPGTVPPAGPCK
jgi:hypothetical protein